MFRASPFFRTQDALLPRMPGLSMASREQNSSLLRSGFHTHGKKEHNICKFSGSDDLYSPIKSAFLLTVYVFGSCFRKLAVILDY